MSPTEATPLELSNGTLLWSANGTWVVRMSDGSVIDVESRPVAGLALLEQDPELHLAIAGFPLASVIRAAAKSDYWAGLALDWAEASRQAPGVIEALGDIETGPRVSQRNRQRAGRLRLEKHA